VDVHVWVFFWERAYLFHTT